MKLPELTITERCYDERGEIVLNYTFFNKDMKVFMTTFTLANNEAKWKLMHFYGKLNATKKVLIAKSAMPIIEKKLMAKGITYFHGKTNHRLANFLKREMGVTVHGEIKKPYPSDEKIIVSKYLRKRCL